MARSLFHATISNELAGVVWTYTCPTAYDAGSDDTNLINGSVPARRAASSVIGSAYSAKNQILFVCFLQFNDSGNVDFRLDNQSTNNGSGSGDNLTSTALASLGLAIEMADGTRFSFLLSALNDTSEPYRGRISGVNATFTQKLLDQDPIKCVLVDTSHGDIDWSALEYTGDTDIAALAPPIIRPNVSLPVPPLKQHFPVSIIDRRTRYPLTTSRHFVQPEVWSWNSQGGADSATITVAGQERADIMQALGWLGHDVTIYYPGTSWPVWSGYIHAVEAPANDSIIRRSLDTYVNDLRVEWTRERDGAVFTTAGETDATIWEKPRFGVRSELVKVDEEYIDLDQAAVDAVVSEYLNTEATSYTEASELPNGARLECRGHAGIFDRRYSPLRDAGQYGSIHATISGTNLININYNVNLSPGHSAIYAYGGFNAVDGHGPFSPPWQQYLRIVRGQGYRRFGNLPAARLRIYALHATNTARPGDRIGLASALLPAPDGDGFVVYWSDVADPFTPLPAAGWWFGFADESGHHDSGTWFGVRSTDMYPSTTNSGDLLLVYGTNGQWGAHAWTLALEFFVGATASGIAQWMVQDEGQAKDLFGAHPLNTLARENRQAPLYLERDTTWRSIYNQLAASDQLCYSVDADRLLRVWSADLPSSEPIVYTGDGSNLGSFIGRNVNAHGREFILTSASYSALDGRVDMGGSGERTSQTAAARIGGL